MAVEKFKTCLPHKEFMVLERIANKYYQGNRSAALHDAVILLNKEYRRGRRSALRAKAAIAHGKTREGGNHGNEARNEEEVNVSQIL